MIRDIYKTVHIYVLFSEFPFLKAFHIPVSTPSTPLTVLPMIHYFTVIVIREKIDARNPAERPSRCWHVINITLIKLCSKEERDRVLAEKCGQRLIVQTEYETQRSHQDIDSET